MDLIEIFGVATPEKPKVVRTRSLDAGAGPFLFDFFGRLHNMYIGIMCIDGGIILPAGSSGLRHLETTLFFQIIMAFLKCEFHDRFKLLSLLVENKILYFNCRELKAELIVIQC